MQAQQHKKTLPGWLNSNHNHMQQNDQSHKQCISSALLPPYLSSKWWKVYKRALFLLIRLKQPLMLALGLPVIKINLGRPVMWANTAQQLPRIEKTHIKRVENVIYHCTYVFEIATHFNSTTGLHYSMLCINMLWFIFPYIVWRKFMKKKERKKNRSIVGMVYERVILLKWSVNPCWLVGSVGLETFPRKKI